MAKVEFDIDHIAKLANLDLTDEDRAQLAEQLPSIVAYISKLHEVDTEKIKLKEYLTDQVNVLRADEVKECDSDVRKAVIDSFPKKTGDMLEVPGVFE